MDQWNIGLTAATIQAGRYGDFQRDQYAAFALSFSVSDARLTMPNTKAAVPLGGSRYRVTGEVVYLTEDVCVLDFGLRVYQASLEGLPQDMRVGAFVAAEIALGVDDGPYDQELFALPDMPPLVYTWYLHRIHEALPDGAAATARLDNEANATDAADGSLDEDGDDEPLYDDVEQTDAWARDAGASYVLSCTRMDYAAQYVRVLPWERHTSPLGADGDAEGWVLRFPEDRAMGLLTTYAGAGAGINARWDVLDAARGMVAVPQDSWLGLTVPPTVVDLSPLAGLQSDDLWRLDLPASGIDNAQLAYLRVLTGLRELGLRDAVAVDDTSVYQLRLLTALQDLDLAGTGVTDAGLPYLHELPALQTLVLTGAPVTIDGVAALRQALPGCTIYSDVEGIE